MLRYSINSLKREKVAASGRTLLCLLQQPQNSIAQNVIQISESDGRIARVQQHRWSSTTDASKDGHYGENKRAKSSKNNKSKKADNGAKEKKESADLKSRLQTFLQAAGQEMYRALMPETQTASAIRGASAKASDIETSSVTDIAVASKEQGGQESAWQKQWRDMRDALGGHPLFKRLQDSTTVLTDNKVVGAGRDMAEAVRERWETSESPFVHRIQDASDSFFQESEAALALREIRARDVSFDMMDFLQRLKGDVPIVIKGYLEGKEDIIKEYCSPEMIERLTGIIKAQKEAGLVPDPTLLDSSDVELVDLKMLEDSPIIVAQFTCQQINCTRDTHGNVVEGAPEEVHRVYYYWALQQEESGYIGEDGKHHPPRWQLREMLIRGMHHLL
eukprot:jgi/Picsp_1/3478/NSC_06316-R1_mitochondrial protein translocase family